MVKHEEEALKKVVNNNTEKFLTAVGIYGVSVAAMLAPVITGLFRNSVSYKTSGGGKSQVRVAPGRKGQTVTPQQMELVSMPEQVNTVRVGSGVIYASKVEDKHGTFAASFDAVQRNLDGLAQRVLGEVAK